MKRKSIGIRTSRGDPHLQGDLFRSNEQDTQYDWTPKRLILFVQHRRVIIEVKQYYSRDNNNKNNKNNKMHLQGRFDQINKIYHTIKLQRD